MDFRTSQISFCNKKALNVVSDKFKSSLLNSLRDKYSVSITDRNAHILNKRSIVNLSKNPHLISLKTIGNNYYLFLTRIDGDNKCFYIDKKIKNGYTFPRVISVNYEFHNDFFNDTLLEGELIREYDSSWMFLIFDIRCYKSISQKNVNIVNKIQNIYTMFADYKENIEDELCPLKIKRFFNYSEFDTMMSDFIPNLNYKVSGLFFNTVNTRHHNYLHFFPRTNNRSKSRVIKNTFTGASVNVTMSIKVPPKHNTVETIPTQAPIVITPKIQLPSIPGQSQTRVFSISKTDKPDVYHIHCIKNNNLVKYGMACIPTLKCSKFVKSTFANNEIGSDIKMEFLYNQRFKKWQPKSVSNVFFPDSFESIQSMEN